MQAITGSYGYVLFLQHQSPVNPEIFDIHPVPILRILMPGFWFGFIIDSLREMVCFAIP